MSITVENISKTFANGFQALKGVSLTVPTGQLTALVGPSGSGKTSLLRIIAGLEQPDPGSGPILFHDENVASTHVRERKVGFVFQHYALFRHMSVFENIAFGLRVRPRKTRPSKAEIIDCVMKLLKLVQLDNMANRLPTQLSGGQRQRVALARALAVEPRVLLLDEPFGALDAKVRKELRTWLRRLHDELHVTSLFVTHDQEEAMEVSDRVVVMNAGRIEQAGTPDEVFHQPATEFVMEFLGQVNLFHGRIAAGRFEVGDQGSTTENPRQAPARMYVRPHDVDLSLVPPPVRARAASDGNEGQGGLERIVVIATVRRIQSAGPTVKIELATIDDNPILAEISHEKMEAMGLKPGAKVYVIPREHRVFNSALGDTP